MSNLVKVIAAVVLCESLAWAQPPMGAGPGRGLNRRDRFRTLQTSTQPSSDVAVCPGRPAWTPARRGGRGQQTAGGGGPVGGRGPRFRASTTAPAAADPGVNQPSWCPRGAGNRGQGNMSSEEHQRIWKLLDNRTAIQRTVRKLDNGVETTTTTAQADLVQPLRQHVRGMLERMEQDRPVRWWDPVFRAVFSRADQIDVTVSDIAGGIVVTQTSDDPEAVKAVKAHAAAVSRFVAEGRSAACPRWAPGSR